MVHRTCRGNGDGMYAQETRRNTGNPGGDRSTDQLTAREGWVGPFEVTERPVVPKNPGNAGGGKEPQLKTDARRDEAPGIGAEPTNPDSGQKLQTASHAGDCVSLFREPDAGNPPVRFDERGQETEPCQTGLRRRSESHVIKPPGAYSHCACPRLYSAYRKL